jgi:cyclic pyranopterin phosphate synthase
MPERMTFLCKNAVLTGAELVRLSKIFIRLGIRKIRITGGEPLVRKDLVPEILPQLSKYILDGNDSTKLSKEKLGLSEITLTTNGSRLAYFADKLAKCGIKRINVSLDTLKPEVFTKITRQKDSLNNILEGIQQALAVGLHVKINCVLLKSVNDGEVDSLIEWCGQLGMDLVFIEVMPMGDLNDTSHYAQYIPLTDVKRLMHRWTLVPESTCTGGPARYWHCQETQGRIGFIAPLTENFCAGCNRVRLTCTGDLYPCLGHDQHVDLRSLLRDGADDDCIISAIREAISEKPEKHNFDYNIFRDTPVVSRHMSVTGG